MKFSDRINNLSEYIFAELGQKAKDIEQKYNKKVLYLGPGTPDIPPSKKYLEILKTYIDEKNSHYYSGYKAISEFETALQSWYETRFNTKIEKDEIQPVLGGKDAIVHLPAILLNQNDEILIPDPGYPAFTGAAKIWQAKPIYYNVKTNNTNPINIKELEKKITTKTKLIFVNFPSNPTGQTIHYEALEPLIHLAKKHKFLIVYDNAYSEITFDRNTAPSILQIPGAKDVAIEIGSFSKTYSFAGFRMGWVVSNKQIINQFRKIKSQIDSGMSLPLQKLGAYALSHQDKEWHKTMIETYKQRRNILMEKFTNLGLSCAEPKAGLYIWAKIPKNEESSYKFCIKLLENKQIFITPGTAFGKNGEGFVRISICSNIKDIDNYL